MKKLQHDLLTSKYTEVQIIDAIITSQPTPTADFIQHMSINVLALLWMIAYLKERKVHS